VADPSFNTDFDPPVGVAETLLPGLRRIVAPNASPMTFRGTNTYLLGGTDVAVIDPGPDMDAHLHAILKAVGETCSISHIFVTHSHVDHSPLSRRLARITGAPVLAVSDSFSSRSARMKNLAEHAELGGGEGVDKDFNPDRQLADGQRIVGQGWSLDAITTPGHFSNHVCFSWPEEAVVFSGDHVMGWATTLVSPPDGDLTAFMASLEKMAARKGDRRYFPGHGAVLEDPQAMISYLLSHRRERESQIIAALTQGAANASELAARIYTEIPRSLLPAATRNVFAHLIDLTDKKKISPIGSLSPEAPFCLIRTPR